MHKTYYFLTNIEEFIDASDLSIAIEDEICGYAAQWCDDNNYWSITGAVMHDGRQLILSPGPRFKTVASAWRNTWLNAYKAVAWDMLLWYSDSSEHRAWADRLWDSNMAVDEIRQRIRHSVPEMLARHYAALASRSAPDVDRLTDHMRACLSRQFELFRGIGRSKCSAVLAGTYDPL